MDNDGRSNWVAPPAIIAQLVIGLAIFGMGDALVVASELGNSPWTVFAEGVSLNSPLSIGGATLVIGATVLLLWLPFRTRPGLGTVLNIIVISFAIDATLWALPDIEALWLRWVILFLGIGVVGAGSGLYLGAAMGPGPRDGLMTGINRVTGWPFAAVRTGIESTAVLCGFLLGGTVGAGSLLFALLIGPAVQTGLNVLAPRAPGASRTQVIKKTAAEPATT